MAKKKIEAAEELSLTPIMNMVLVLIPLMLLNVVFMTINVIEVTMPQRSAGAAAAGGEPPKRLQLFVTKQGITVVENGNSLPARAECKHDGVTVCASDSELEVETDRYNWLDLYNTLFEIKDKGDWADHDQIEIVADSAVNFGVLVKVMDIARYQRVPSSVADATKGRLLTSVAELNESQPPYVDVTDETTGATAKMPLGMFPVVVLGMPTVSQ